MQSNKIFIGIDVSKLTFDASIQGTKLHLKTSNNAEGFKILISWLKQQKIQLDQCWFVFEYVGFYEYRLMQFCHSKNINFTRVSGLQIKKSMGIVHGKNDKIDAKRIADYAFEKRDSLIVQNPLSDVLMQLKLLFSQRNSFVQSKKIYQVHLKEWKHKMGFKDNDPFLKPFNDMYKECVKQIEKIEKKMLELINSNEELKQNYNLLISIPGIGMINATVTIIYTENFTRFSDPRKYASFCGVAPFENTSGTSLKGKATVCFFAHKHLKALLNNGARSAVQHNQEMKDYYKRKVEEGKNEFSVLNAVRFKLICRMFSVVKKQTYYVDNLIFNVNNSKIAS